MADPSTGPASELYLAFRGLREQRDDHFKQLVREAVAEVLAADEFKAQLREVVTEAIRAADDPSLVAKKVGEVVAKQTVARASLPDSTGSHDLEALARHRHGG